MLAKFRVVHNLLHFSNFVRMRIFLSLFTFLLVICALQGNGQTPDSIVMQPNTLLLRRLLASPSVFQISTVLRKGVGNIDIGVPMHTTHPYDLFKKRDGLFAHIGATGIIYKITETAGGDSVMFRRMDKTTHFGYNINAFGFTLGGRIYNFGGYGYWRWNGQLREYNDRMKEWHIIPLSRELPVVHGGSNSFLWLDSAEHRVFVLRTLLGNEAVQNDPIRWGDSALMLNLKDMQWLPLGLTPKIEVSNDIELVLASLDSGLLLHARGGIEYWNFLSNKVRLIMDDSIRAELLTKEGNLYMWYENGHLLIGAAETGALDSMSMGSDDFFDTGRTVYIPFRPSLSYTSAVIGVMILCVSLFIWYRRKRPGKKVFRNNAPGLESVGNSVAVEDVSNNGGVSIGEISVAAPVLNQEVFDAVEWSLLKLLHQHSREPGRTTSTQEVNRILGVANKTLDMQKRKRSDVLRSINRKYQLVFPDRTGELILKERSEQDGRQSEYRLNPTEISMVGEYLH
jgi:hypothetical protein